MSKIVVVDPLYTTPAWSVGPGWLGPDHEVVVPPDFEPASVRAALPGAHVILTVFRPVTGEMMDVAGAQLRVVSKPGAGFDNIDAAAATERGVMVCNVEGVRGRAVAEHAFFMALYLARHTWMQTEQKKWEHVPAVQLGGKEVGIVGLGDIGRHAARIAAGFGARILVSTRTEDPSYVPEARLEFVGREEILARSDYLILCMPLTPDTRGMIRKETLAAMKKDAILVNVSRGPAVVTDDLYEAMKAGRLTGAGLDVTDPEPLPSEHPLWTLDNVLISPHHASRTPETQAAAMQRSADNVCLVLEEKRPINLANPAVLEGKRP